MASTFKSPDIDTLTQDKIRLTNSKILDYLVQTKNIEAAKYVDFLIKNLDKDGNKNQGPYDKLLYTNQKILSVLEKIEKNMIDEQDTAIKHPESSSINLDFDELFNSGLPGQDIDSLMDSDFDLDDMYDIDRKKDKIRSSSKSNKNKGKTKPGKSSKSKTIGKTPEDSGKPRKSGDANVKKDNKNEKKSGKSKNIAKKAADEALKPLPKGLVKAAGPLAMAVDAAFAVADYATAESDAERTEAISSGIAGAGAGVLGALALSWIPVVGPIAGYAIGNWLGSMVGENFAELISDPEDSIPDEITRMGPEAELEFIDKVMIPKFESNPDIKDSDKKKNIDSLNKYKENLKAKIARGYTQEEKYSYSLGRLETWGIIDTNFIGNSEILDWDNLEKHCTLEDINALIDYNDWDVETLSKLRELKLLKENQKSEKHTKSSANTTSSIDNINKAIQAEKARLEKAVKEQDTKEIQKTQSILNALEIAKQNTLQKSNQPQKTIKTKQSALEPNRQVKVADTPPKQFKLDYDLSSNSKVRIAEQNLSLAVKNAMASEIGDMSYTQILIDSRMSNETANAIANMQPSNTKFNPDDGLGAISGKYESNGDPGVISSGKGDAGGKSYGAWQIASKTGTLGEYIEFAKNKYPMLADAAPASSVFDQIWKGIAQKDPQGFLQNQYDFIKKTHYDPVYDYAIQKGLDVSNKAVCSALWSQSVQHGLRGNKRIIDWALTEINGSKDPQVIIRALYSARSRYVTGLNMDPDTKASVLKRYQGEVGDALSMNQQIQSGELQNNPQEQMSSNAAKNASVNTVNVENANTLPIQNSIDESINNTNNAENANNVQTEIDKIDQQLEDLEIEEEELEILGNHRGNKEKEQKIREKREKLLAQKQFLSSQIPAVDKTSAETAINSVSKNLSDNTANMSSNSQTIVVNNNNSNNVQMQRKDNELEPNSCNSGVFSDKL